MCCRIQFCMIHGGVPAIFSVLESSEVKFPALEGFVLPTYFPSRLGNLTTTDPTNTNYQPLNKNDGTQPCNSCHENTPVVTKKRSIGNFTSWWRPHKSGYYHLSSHLDQQFCVKSGENHQIWISLQVRGESLMRKVNRFINYKEEWGERRKECWMFSIPLVTRQKI